MKSLIATPLCLLLFAAGARAEVAGTVQSRGWPLAGVQVTLPDGSSTTTDNAGRFRFVDHQGPLPVHVSHPWYRPRTLECGTDTAIELETWARDLPEAVVLAERTRNRAPHPVPVATWIGRPGETPAPPASAVDLVAQAPGASETGQGGLFQAYAIRGMGGQRVLSLVGGVPLVTDRRAGATASFIDPSLLESVGVVRGPFSSQVGSGALGGVVELLPRLPDGPVAGMGWQSEGNQRHLMAGTGTRDLAVAVAYRRSGDTETPDGLALPSRFEQGSAVLGGTLGGKLQGRWLLAPAAGRDIGKPNTRYPSRVTRYPGERHLLGALALELGDRWDLALNLHPNTLETENLNGSETSTVENRALDGGLALNGNRQLLEGLELRTGLEWQTRRGVRALETVSDTGDGTRLEATTLDGSQDEVSLRSGLHHTVLRGSLAGSTLALGFRHTRIAQDNRGSTRVSDQATSAFMGLTVPLGAGLELALNTGSGFRFPGLAERWYSGSTGRGTVVANQGLGAEHSLSADLGLRVQGAGFRSSLTVFTMTIDDYIERVDLGDGVRSYRNLTAGRLQGIELESRWQALPGLELEGAVQVIRGEAEDSTPLAEVPSDRLRLGTHWQRDRLSARLQWQHRFERSKPGPGEVATGSAEIVSASLAFSVQHALVLEASASNLLDRTWLPTADELAVPAPGRSLGLALRWSPGLQ